MTTELGTDTSFKSQPWLLTSQLAMSIFYFSSLSSGRLTVRFVLLRHEQFDKTSDDEPQSSQFNNAADRLSILLV